MHGCCVDKKYGKGCTPDRQPVQLTEELCR